MELNRKIPVTVVTGFLGAGKTTFINQLLKTHSHLKLALIENELGEEAIDTKLIRGVDASQMFELKEGCICCTISDEYEQVLLELAERNPDIDHVLIETTGVADPSGAISPFLKDKRLANRYEYRGCFCLVDARYFNLFDEPELFHRQVLAADLLLINKIDQLEDRRQLIKELQNINPFAVLKEVLYGKAEGVDLGMIPGQGKLAPRDMNRHSHPHVQSKTILFSYPLVKKEFLQWLSYNLDIYKKQIYRTKGILYFQDEPFEYLIHGVGGSFEISEQSLSTGGKSGVLVFIGKLDEVELDYQPGIG